MLSSHLIFCNPLLLLPPNPHSIRVFSNESTLRMRWSKYWSFSFSISPSNEYSEPISFRMAWLDLLAVQGNLKSLLQHHSSRASILRHSAFFTVQLSHPYMTTGKTIALTRQALQFNNCDYLLRASLSRFLFLEKQPPDQNSYKIFFIKIIFSNSISCKTFTYKRDAAAAAKTLQSCPTLCDPTDGSPPGSPVPGILQARTLERVAISFFNV